MHSPQRTWLRRLAAFLAALAAAATVHAEDRALLVGVGTLKQLEPNLPGVDLDVEAMRRVADGLGYRAVKTLSDKEATLEGVRAAFKTWLIEGTGERDRVLFYFSGHGTRVPDLNGDEASGQDDALVMHDARPAVLGGRKSLEGVLIDDELGQLLSQLRSKNVLVILDACHSGSATKSLKLVSKALNTAVGVPKFIRYDGMPAAPVAGKGGMTKDIVVAARTPGSINYVALSAAGDLEQAIATAQGSAFTLGLSEAFTHARERTDTSLTPNDLLRSAARYVEQNIDATQRFHPEIHGDPALAARPLQMVATIDGGGPFWRATELAASRMDALQVTLNKPTYRYGDLIEITVQVPKPGFLNVVTINPFDVPTVLFPNQFQKDNRVPAGALRIPTAAMAFDLKAAPPAGAMLVAAFLSDEPLDFYGDGAGARDSAGKMKDQIARLSTGSLGQLAKLPAKDIVVAGRAPMLMAGAVHTRTCAAAGACGPSSEGPLANAKFPDEESLTPGIFLEDAVALLKALPTKPTRKVFAKGLELTRQAEGFRSRLYNDVARLCTIAYGHLVRRAPCDGSEPLEFLRGVGPPRGTELLSTDLALAERAVMSLVTASGTLTDGQFAALSDFTYNVGIANFRKSQLLKAVNAGEFDRVPYQLRRWTLAGGKEWPGLKKRREGEIRLFFEGVSLPKDLGAKALQLEDTSPVDIRKGE